MSSCGRYLQILNHYTLCFTLVVAQQAALHSSDPDTHCHYTNIRTHIHNAHAHTYTHTYIHTLGHQTAMTRNFATSHNLSHQGGHSAFTYTSAHTHNTFESVFSHTHTYHPRKFIAVCTLSRVRVEHIQHGLSSATPIQETVLHVPSIQIQVLLHQNSLFLHLSSIECSLYQ